MSEYKHSFGYVEDLKSARYSQRPKDIALGKKNKIET